MYFEVLIYSVMSTINTSLYLNTKYIIEMYLNIKCIFEMYKIQ